MALRLRFVGDILRGLTMGYGCPAKCATGIQGPLDLLELTALPKTARAEIALLRGTALLCESCGCIYVVSRTGTAAVGKFPSAAKRI